MHFHLFVETVAAAVLVAAGAVLLVAGWGARGRPEAQLPSVSGSQPPRDGPSLMGMLLVVAASLSLGSAVLHLAVFQDHLADYAPFGMAFAGLGLFQLVTGLALLRPSRSLPALVVAVNAGVIAVWAVSRTLGLPIGPHPWLAEPVGLADAMATAFEIGLVSLLLLSVRIRGTVNPAAAHSRQRLQVAVVPTVGVIGLMTLVALASLAGGGHAHS